MMHGILPKHSSSATNRRSNGKIPQKEDDLVLSREETEDLS